MKRIRLGVFFSDREYGDRFAACLMNHYRQQLELHIFSEPDALWEEELDAVLLEGHVAQGKRRYPIFCLYDEETDAVPLEGQSYIGFSFLVNRPGLDGISFRKTCYK